jgi:hypothetical protein
MADGRPRSANKLLEGGKCEVFAGGFEGFTQQQEARSVITDGERIAIMPVGASCSAVDLTGTNKIGHGRP